jgi:zinc protease
MNFRVVSTLGTAFLAAASTGFAIGGVDAPPAPSDPHDVIFSQPKETRLENGVRVIVVERPGLPLLAAELLVRNGAETDPKDRAGCASMTGSLLTRGTETKSAPQIASAMESLGGAIDSGARWDAASAGIVVMSNKAEAALAILADVILHPAFKQEEIDRLKNQTLDGLRVVLEQPGPIGRYVTDRVIFGEGEYGHAAGGTPETVQAITRDDIVRLYQAYFTPDNATLILSGNLTLEDGKRYAQQFFGSWKTNQSVSKEPLHVTATDWKPANVVIDLPQAGQASVTVAKPSIKRDSPDYYAGLVANAALGQGFVSRLNREIRIKRGLSYGVRSAMDSRRSGGSFFASAQTKNESAAEVAGLLQIELKRLNTEPVEGKELKSRQAMLTGAYARNLETNRGFVSQVASLVTYDRPMDTLNKFMPTINAITTNDVTAFAAKYFDTPPSLIVVGKAPAFMEALKKDFQDIKVIPQHDLDLNRADLTKVKP